MPAIRKIRIVNFRFNDGTKLIPDEIFCTEDSEGKPVDTLLNLENGGGKSVIVQLLLQPVCPKAKVQNRNISDFFQKGTDHAFVLIEWALDGSKNSLLTGIALAAGTNADDQNESKTVRFYTFMHDYSRSGDKLDLINLPLTERSGKHIRPLSFEELRKFLQNKNVEYYPSDSLRRYQKRLEEYGIMHTEWENILVRINTIEGGISKFFEEYTTADKLLDKFIIPGVLPGDFASQNELEEMFINYADSYAGQEENLRLKSEIISFTEKLENILPIIRNIWDAEDAKIQAIRRLADYLFTLEHNIGEYNDKLEQLEKQISEINEKLLHIRVEKASGAYYLAQNDFHNSAIQLSECSQKKEEAESQCDKLEHMIKVLNAAKEYAELCELKNEESAILAKIRALENQTQDSRILSLKYSLSVKASELKWQTETELQKENGKRKELSENLYETKDRIKQLLNEQNRENKLLNQAEGSGNILLEQINNGLENLGRVITVMFDGEYSREDIENIRSDFDKKQKLLFDELSALKNEETLLHDELLKQEPRRDELIRIKADLNAALEQQKSALGQYNTEYKSVVSVLQHLSIPESKLFTDEPKTTIERIIADKKETLGQAERSAEELREKISRIEAGQLHLSETAANFLECSGISFQTGEQYLRLQPAKIREDILSSEPLCAYSVLVASEKDRQRLLSQTETSWLSSVVPVYTRSEIADMAEGKWKISDSFLSSFDREYFRDFSEYEKLIRQKFSDRITDIDNLKAQISEWEEEQKILSYFNYSADYENKLKAKISSREENILKAQNELSGLDLRKVEINKRTKELAILKDKKQSEINRADKEKSEFGRICETISQYEKMSEQICVHKENLRALSVKIRKEQENESSLCGLLQECKDKTERLENSDDEYNKLLEELKDAEKSELLSGDYSSMLSEYYLYKKNYSADIQELQLQLEEKQDKIKKKDIGRFSVSPSEYENTAYSDGAYRRTEEQLSLAKKENQNASDQYSKAVECHAKAESKLKQAQDKLSELNAELLPREEVGSDFGRRIKEQEVKRSEVQTKLQQCNEHLGKLETERIFTEKCKKKHEDFLADYTPKINDEQQLAENVENIIEECIERQKRAENKAKEYHRSILEPFRNSNALFVGTLDGILSVIDNNSIKGDKYFTLYSRTEDDIRRYRERIVQLEIMLKDVEDSRNQIVGNCSKRAERLYDNLKLMSKRSAVRIGNSTRQMIRIDLPDIEPMSELPVKRIDQYITEQVKKYLSEKGTTPRRERLEIRQLLNCYIGKETIPISVYKIDKNIQNSCYRSWQDAQKANSGGEQFVILFSIIASVMNYTRGYTSSLNSTSGVLILDNPFGSISSEHLLEPVFRIARHFHIQLICLTHLGTATVTGSFAMVYQLRFRTLPLSNMQVLESEAKQSMEHAYYLSEQLSLS